MTTPPQLPQLSVPGRNSGLPKLTPSIQRNPLGDTPPITSIFLSFPTTPQQLREAFIAKVEDKILKYKSLCFLSVQPFLTFPLVGRSIYLPAEELRVVMTGNLRVRKGYFSECLFPLKAYQRVNAKMKTCSTRRPGGLTSSCQQHSSLFPSLVFPSTAGQEPPMSCAHTSPQMTLW